MGYYESSEILSQLLLQQEEIKNKETSVKNIRIILSQFGQSESR